MKISEHYGLKRTQAQLEFIDVDLLGDTRLFVDPRALRLLDSEWGERCVALIQDYFRHIIQLIGTGRNTEAQRLLSVLGEPNETHLGLSTGRPKGHGIGPGSAVDLWEALSESEAVRSGLLEDLEDTILMIPGISNDLISDIATNIIRGPLIQFTQEVCRYYGIPLSADVDSGPIWYQQRHQWDSEFVELPITQTGKLLLVPKVIVRRRMEYNPDEYFRHFVLTSLQEAELSANSELVRLLKNGTRRVTKRDLIEKYGSGKAMIVEQTRRNPQILDDYRRAKRNEPSKPLSHRELDESYSPPDWDQLLKDVIDVEPGRAGADQYHRAIEALFQALFYPALVDPNRESRIHGGRKRIDIRFTNASRQGFFWRVHEHHEIPAGYVVVECKNFSEEVANPEVDQVSGRFSPTRGRLGLLVCRQIEDRDLLIERCKDTASDNRGWVIPLDDEDLGLLVEERKTSPDSLTFTRLEELFGQIIS